MGKKQQELVVIYARTSSKSNVGDDKDSRKRQEGKCMEYAKKNGYKVVQSFYDAGVSGTTYLHLRPAFRDLLDFCNAKGIKKILIESCSRLSRDLLISEISIEKLNRNHLLIIPVDAPDSFTGSNPTNIFMRQILGSVAELEKSSLVDKLRVARERKRKETGRCEGRKSIAETKPEVIKLAKKLYRKPKGGKRKSLMRIAIDLETAGYKTAKGNRYSASSVKRMGEG